MASGTENYITVGNFYGFASMNLVVQNTHGQFPNGNISYMYFDDFHIDTCFADINLGKDTSICFGDSLHFDGTTPLAAYRWQNGSTDSTFTAFEAGKYWVEVSSKGCVKSDTIILKSVTKQVDIGKDTIICFGDSFYLNAFTPNASYLWDDSSTLSVRLVNDSATYWVIVFDTMGCNLSDTIRVKLDSCAEIGIDQKKNNKDCATNIYWNEEKLHFQFLEYSEITSLIIYNGKGEKVVDENIFWSRNSEIDISFLSSGLYILVARNDQCTFFKKILAH
jgi:hypothetical protein